MNKKNSINTIELLSPAKDLECGLEAINCGADAVYIGAPKYGARAAVGNSIVDIEKLIKYAQKYWARVYVTINTILYDNELEDVQNLIHKLYDVGADAIIIQDTGILEMPLPPIPIFASTQTHNYSIDKIKFLEGSGIKRIILARELSLDQIKEIRENTVAELEFFVHGALCVCFSGQCYFSYVTTGRSANRGECSQPCRMLYSLEDGKGKKIIENKYLLSLKDLNLSNRLKELIEAGISSFKIEGRLKDKNYVKNITSFYRQRIDEVLADSSLLRKTSSGKSIISFLPDPDKTFNRGYTEYFVDGKRKKVASIHTQKSTGKYIGTVKNIGRDYFDIDSPERIVNDDGLCYFDKENVLYGMIVNKVEVSRIYTKEINKLYKGCKIFRNRDYQFNKELSNGKVTRKIEVFLTLKDSSDNLVLSAIDEDNCYAEASFSFKKQIAINPLQSNSTIIKQLKKSGDSIFTVGDVKVNFTQSYFLSISEINRIRRIVLNLLELERIKNHPHSPSIIPSINTNYPEKNLSFQGNVINHKARDFYIKRGVENIEDGFEIQKETKGKVILTSKYCIKYQLDLCPFQSEKSKIEKIEEPLFLIDSKNKYKLEFNCAKCEMYIKL